MKNFRMLVGWLIDVVSVFYDVNSISNRRHISRSKKIKINKI